MRTLTSLILLLLCLNFSQHAQAQQLNKPVTLEYKSQQLGTILADISRKYKVNFSYANNLVPVNHKTSVSVKKMPLHEALTLLLQGTGLEFEEVGSQIVLKRATPKPPVKTAETAPARPEPIDPVKARPVNLQASTALPEPDYATILQTENLSRERLRQQYLEERSKLRRQYFARLDSLETTADTEAIEELKGQFRRIMASLQREVTTLSDSVKTEQIRQRHYTPRSRDTASADTSGYFYSTAQATFVPPISTNGLLAGQTVNGLSLNFVGRSAGLDGAEFGLLVNSERDFMHGGQFSGLINHVQGTVRGGQFAGFLNLSGGTLNGFQGAGFANIATGEVRAFQGAGFLNYARGTVKGAQAAGFLNIARKNMNGAQMAGFLNIASDTITGSQLSGFMNKGKVVHGSQIGFFNLADSVSGVQIGFLSIAKKGYRRLELSGAETFHGNIAFKTGTRKFYNIFAVGGRQDGNIETWSYGYGFGTEQRLSKRFTLSLDLLGHQVHRDGFQGKDLNLLGQFKPTLGVLLGNQVSIFAGPTANVFVSDNKRYRPLDAAASEDAPTTLAPSNYVFSNTSGGVNVTGWVGFSGGIRF